MLCYSFIDQQNVSKLNLKGGQEAKDVMFSLASQESLVFCYRQGQELFLCLCVCSEIYVTFSKIVDAYFGIVLYAELAQGSKAAQTTPKSASQICRPVGNSNIPDFQRTARD